MKDIYRDWMEFCEYAPEEMDKEYPRLREAFKRLTLEEADIQRGKERAVKYFQCNLRGMRMILGCLVRTCVDMILSKDEGKLKFFFEMPMGMIGPVLGAASLVRDDIVVACPGMYHELLMGNFFDKYDFLIQFAEERQLPQGVSHCGCNQAKYALKGMGIVPVADLNVSTGNYCDEAPKADEGVAREFGERQIYMYRPQDEYLYEPPGQGEHLEYFAGSIDLVRQELADVVGAEITDDMVKKNLYPYLLMAAELKKLEEIRAHCDPQVLRSAVHDFVWASYTFSPGLQGHERRMEALRVLIEELNGMVARGEGVVEKGAPRVMYGPLNSFVTPGIGHTLEEAGINLCCFEAYGNPNVSPEEMALMIDNTPASVIIAMMWLCYPMIFLNCRIASMKAGIDKAGNMDGILMLAHHACRIFGSDMLMMKKALKEDMKVDIPIVIVEYDIYDPKYYNAEQIGNRLESFAEVVKVYKASKALYSSQKH
jgi:benzoyl-CoA reductase/2-hydroxyglutaryl-CoA dehydratase subunit BcrC/BadD/HgdB